MPAAFKPNKKTEERERARARAKERKREIVRQCVDNMSDGDDREKLSKMKGNTMAITMCRHPSTVLNLQ